MKIHTRKLFCVCLMLVMFCAASTAVFAADKLNINKATVSDLVVLKGIGEKTATNIIEYRSSHGDFKDIAELVNVKGIGEKTFAKLAGQIAVSDEIVQQ